MGSGRSNLELAHAINRALNEEGTEGILPFYSEDVVWQMPEGWLEQPVFRGRDGIRELANAWFGQFDEYHWEEVEVREIDEERVLGLYMMSGKSKGTGIPAEQPVALIVRFSDGLVVHVDSFFDWDEARRAASGAA